MKGFLLAVVAVPFVLVLLLGAGIYSVVPAIGGDDDEHTTVPSTANTQPGVAAPFTGASSGCSEPDPTNRDGCLTPPTAWLYGQLKKHFADLAMHCWDRHLWNPNSDHPQGRACDITIGSAGRFPNSAENAHGWAIANWLRTNAAALDISYVIWDGQIWSVSRDSQGWRLYDGGGVYDVTTPTGGHYDHVHVSTKL